MAKLVLSTIGSRYGSIDALNANFEAIQEAFDNVLSRDGTSPNTIEANIDANSYRIINLPTPVDTHDAATKGYVDEVTSVVSAYVDQIDVVAANIDEVVELSAYAADLADSLPAISNVNADITNIDLIAGNIGSVELVGLDLNGAFQSGVVYDFGLITEDPLGTAPEATSSIVIVATSISNVNTVATNIADVNTVVTNLTAIQNASTYASNAATSASAAATSATNAATSASNASTSATNAATSETNASTYAGNASSSASSAASSASSAQTAADTALAALDSFDDRYLGQKSVEPTLDNDGNALVAGALYFNTVDNAMKVYDGASWLDAYASLSGALLVANNLSDLSDAPTARTNLGLGSLATLSNVGTTNITNNAVTVDKLAATLDYGSIA